VMVSNEQTTPPPLPTRDHEAVALAVLENLVPVAAQAGGGATELLTTDTMSAINFKIIDLDAPDLPSNDRDIFEAVLKRMLADPVERRSRSLSPRCPRPRPRLKWRCSPTESPRRAPSRRGS
jgi:hypothetical protein